MKKISETCEKMINSNFLQSLEKCDDEMQISKVVAFFSKHNKVLTKTMIQNYVKIKVLPPPIEKRYYSKNHLILLNLITDLKSVFSLEDIKRVLDPIMKDIDTFEDDIINMNEIYKIYAKLFQSVLIKWEESLPAVINNINGLVNNSNVRASDKKTASFFLAILKLMTESVATTQLVKNLLDDFENKNQQIKKD